MELSVGLSEDTVGGVTSAEAIHAAPNFSHASPYSLLSEQLLSNKTIGTRTRRTTGFVLLDEYT